MLSQPARAVWIEIANTGGGGGGGGSHSLRGLCGLKWCYNKKPSTDITSQPARAVWIEICVLILGFSLVAVTACEGCVD